MLRDPRWNVPQQGIHKLGYTRLFNLGLASYLCLSGVDYKALTGLSLMRVPQQSVQGCKPPISVLNPDTTSTNNSENPPTAYRRKPQLL
jgi:hypothetical protein